MSISVRQAAGRSSPIEDRGDEPRPRRGAGFGLRRVWLGVRALVGSSPPAASAADLSRSGRPVPIDPVKLKAVVLELPPDLREVLLLSRVAGLSQQTIASHLNISGKAVEWRLSRALSECGRRLRE